jgi:large subunit ribosomal protein L25
MAESVVLATEKRDGRGSRLAAKLRKEHKVPAVVYGHKEETLSVSVSHEALLAAVRHNARVVDLQLGGKTEKAQIVELQWDHLGKDVLHVDFKRVSAHERINVTVPIEVRGVAPGVADGGVLDQPMHLLHIECPALEVPASVRVAVNELQVEQAIHVRELKLPPGVKALDDPEAIVVHVTKPKVAVEAPAEAAAPATAEPEVITRKKGEEEGEEAKK